MTEESVAKIIYEHITKNVFPKNCEFCGKTYNSLKQYVLETVHEGYPISYDAQFDEWDPEQPLGTISMSSCSCGSTITLSSYGMAPDELFALLKWAKQEAEKRGITFAEMLDSIRNCVDQLALRNDNSDEK